MSGEFAGDTAWWYARYRRDLPADQAAELAARLGLSGGQVVVDLGCGTGQLGVPLRSHAGSVVAVDPEVGMLAGLRARAVPQVVCVLGDDGDLPEIGRLIGPVGAVVVGNALHLMDEPAALRACTGVLAPGAAVAVVTQGPPLWLGSAPWQQRVRRVLEQILGPVTGTCGSDAASVAARAGLLTGLNLNVQVATWAASHEVNVDWVVGHLGSALPAGALQDTAPGSLAAAVRAALVKHGDQVLVERVTTTVVIAHGPS